jgi:hypothetical protein
LLWISPAAGLSGTATEASIGGGTDEEELKIGVHVYLNKATWFVA